MRDTAVAGRYAQALHLLVQKKTGSGTPAYLEQLTTVHQDLLGLAELAKPGSRIGDFLASPEVRPQDKRDALKRGLGGRATPAVVVFADLLLRKKRMNIAPEIAREFGEIVDRAQGLQRAELVSAVPLMPAEKSRLVTELQRVTGHKIELTERLEPGLLGGAYVRIGDRVIDRSVKSLLEVIAQKLYETSV